MQTQNTLRKFLRQFNVDSLVVKVSIAALLGLMFAGVSVSISGGKAQARALVTCAGGDQTYIVVGGDTLGGIARRFATTWQILAQHNHIANPNLIYTHQTICVPGRGAVGTGSSDPTPKSAPVTYTPAPPVPAKPAPVSVPVGHNNVFPYGACTWWANQRYYQLHGVFVPWRINSNAWQWTARAYEFGWRVSSQPTVGAILDLQPYVQYASYMGHVAVVERILGNGHVIASSMSWAPNYWAVSYYEFAPGPGVTFISQ